MEIKIGQLFHWSNDTAFLYKITNINKNTGLLSFECVQSRFPHDIGKVYIDFTDTRDMAYRLSLGVNKKYIRAWSLKRRRI